MKLISLAIVANAILFGSFNAQAQQAGTGLGFLFGEPAGVSVKLWRTTNTAFSAGMGWSFVDDGAIDFHFDHIWHNWTLLDVQQGELPIYFGLGGRLAVDDNNSQFGFRVPVGLNYLFARSPIDMFVEVVPVLEVAPTTDWTFNGAVGVRYFFGRTRYSGPR